MAENRSRISETFREFEHGGWQRVAGGYHDYFSSLTGQTISPLLDAVGADRSTNLLDIATGPGYAAAAAAQRGAQVIGVDFSAVMVEKASQLYPGLSFQEADAQALPFASGSFDAAIMNFGLLHLDKPEQALREAYRVLRPGGRFGFTVWAQPDKAVAFGLVLRGIEEHGNPNVPLPPGPPFFRFSDPAESGQTLVQAGFVSPAIDIVSMSWQLASPADLFKAFYQGTPRTGGLLRAQTSEDLANIEAAVTRAAQKYVQNDVLQIPMAALVVSAIRD